MLGALWSGAAISPANPQYTMEELVYQLKDSQAKMVVAHYTSKELVRKACAKVGILEANILLEGTPVAHEYSHWLTPSSTKDQVERPEIDPEADIAFLVYSSGTTGKPKGVRLSHFNITSNVLQAIAGEYNMLSWDGSRGNQDFPPSPTGDKFIACLPFYHIYGLTLLIMVPLYEGLHCLVMPKFELEKWCRLVQDHKVTLGFIVPPIAVLLVNHPCVPRYDLSSIRICTSGAAPLSRGLIDACYERTRIRIKQGYGLSETSPVLCAQKWDDWRKKAGCVGPLVPNIEAKFYAISDFSCEQTNQDEVPEGSPGELYVRGPNIFLGYHNNESSTADCLDHEGWFRTGDIGYLDNEGNLYITDRAKELIKYKGFQIAPAELEGYLLEHPLVEDVVVVGVNSKLLDTEVPRAYVVRTGGMGAVREGDVEKLISWLSDRVAPHKRLRGGVKFVTTIPKSATGKILRRLVRDSARKEFALDEEAKMKLKL